MSNLFKKAHINVENMRTASHGWFLLGPRSIFVQPAPFPLVIIIIIRFLKTAMENIMQGIFTDTDLCINEKGNIWKYFSESLFSITYGNYNFVF